MARGSSKRNSQDIQREILGILSTVANVSVAELSALLALKPHVVRYNLQFLLEDRRVNSSLLFNSRALGHVPFNIFFDLAISKQSKALTFLKSRHEVMWLTTVTGPRRFESTIIAENYDAHAEFIRELGQATETHLRDPVLGIEVEYRHWGLRFLMQPASAPTSPLIHFRFPPRPSALDDLDRKILFASLMPRALSLRKLAESLKVPQTTVKYRLDRLMAEKVISERLFFVEPNTFFMHAQLVIDLKANSPESHARVIQVCEGHRNVEGLVSGVGNWDFKVLLVAESFKQLLAVERTIKSALVREINRSSLYLREEILLKKPVLPKRRPS